MDDIVFIVYMLEAARLASHAAQTANSDFTSRMTAVYWYAKAGYWAERLGDVVAAADYRNNAEACS